MELIRRALDRAFPNPGYLGWVAAGMGLLCAALSGPGQSFALSFYLEPLMDAAAIGRFEISTLYSVTTLGAALALPLVGARADRTGGGRYLGAILLLMAGAMVLLSATTTIWLLAISFFALRLLGQGAIGIGTLTLTVRWFDRHRGRAFALVALGYAIGEVAFPVTILELIERVGWRGSLLVFAGAYALLFAPLVSRFSRDPRPGELIAERSMPDDEPARVSHRLAGALRTPVFYGMAIVQTVSPLIVTAVIFHQVGLFRSLGRDAGAAAEAMVGFGVAALIGTYLSGFLVERVPERVALSVALLPLGGGLALLALVPGWGAAPVAYGSLLGASAGSLKIAGALVWPAYYGPLHIGAIKGAVTTIRNAATAAGPPLAAVLAGPDDHFRARAPAIRGGCLRGCRGGSLPHSATAGGVPTTPAGGRVKPSNLEILAYEDSPLGPLCLRRRELLSMPGTVVTEVTLNHEFLMSSHYTASETALSRLALDLHAGSKLRVLVGGLGLGYTAHAALESSQVTELVVVELLPQVVDWLERDLLPLSAELRSDERFRTEIGDFFERMAAPPGEGYDVILIDIDHAPDHWIHHASAPFYTKVGLKSAKAQLTAGGVLAVWSSADSREFRAELDAVFEVVTAEPVTYFNALADEERTDWIFLAR